MQDELFQTRPAYQHRLMECMASARFSPERARELICSPDAHKAFIAELCAGMS